MYAIIEVGAKQYKVKKGDIIDTEKQVTPKGKEILLENVILVSKEKKVVGQPYLKDAKVTAIVLEQIKGEKKVSYKYRRRKSSHWKKGHRQCLTRLKIEDISLGS
jgi:large subunit ribosomal protein L21